MDDKKPIDVVVLNKEGLVRRSVDLSPAYLLGHSITRFARSGFPDETIYIEDALKEAECNVKRVPVSWPRNSYVRLGRIYYTPDYFYERYPGFAFLGNGGGVIPGDGFVLVSSIHIPPEIKGAKEKIKSELKKVMPVDIYLIPPFCDNTFMPHSDIDTTVGCITDARLVTVDKKHYERDKEYFQEVEAGTKYEVVPIDCGDELLGNNYLIVRELEKTVINNKASTRVNAELKNLGVTVIETSEPLQVMPFFGGVRCASHWMHNESLLEDIVLIHVGNLTDDLFE